MITFKTIEKYFNAERDGLKNWTIREIPPEPDVRFIELAMMMNQESYKTENKEIKIVHSEDPNQEFVRQIKHITTWKNCYLITWRQTNE